MSERFGVLTGFLTQIACRTGVKPERHHGHLSRHAHFDHCRLGAQNFKGTESSFKNPNYSLCTRPMALRAIWIANHIHQSDDRAEHFDAVG